MSNHFKTQQEIWKYVADGGVVINVNSGKVLKFENGFMECVYIFAHPDMWKPYIEPKVITKTKVWCWEKIYRGTTFGFTYIGDTSGLYCEGCAAKNLHERTIL